MRTAACTTLLTLCACYTPSETERHTTETVERLGPLLQSAAVTKSVEQVERKFQPRIEAMEGAVEAGDDAVRRELEEAFRTARDARRDMIADNARGHTMMLDKVERADQEAREHRKQIEKDLSVLAGKVEGTDASIQSQAGVIRGMLLQASVQLNRTEGIARQNERSIKLAEESRAIENKRILKELSDENERENKAFQKRMEDGFWDLVQKLATVATALAGAVAALVGIIVAWRRKKKANEDKGSAAGSES